MCTENEFENVYICKYLGTRIAFLASELSFVLSMQKEKVPEGMVAEKGLGARGILALMVWIKGYF